jgi:CrcB protein
MIGLSLIQLGLIGVAGAAGALTRYLLGRFVAERVLSQIPVGTFIINISGAFLIGLIAGLVGHNVISAAVQLVLATGFLGGYTTFSTMHWEGTQLIRSGGTARGLLYLGGTFALGVPLAALGLRLGGWLSWHRRFQHVAGFSRSSGVDFVALFFVFYSAVFFKAGWEKGGRMIF